MLLRKLVGINPPPYFTVKCFLSPGITTTFLERSESAAAIESASVVEKKMSYEFAIYGISVV